MPTPRIETEGIDGDELVTAFTVNTGHLVNVMLEFASVEH